MPALPPGAVPRFETIADYDQARECFARAGYTAAGITKRLALDAVPTSGTVDTPLLRWRTRGGDPLDTLIRLFVMAAPVAADAARGAIAPVPLDAWLDAGLVRPDGEGARATVRVVPYAGLLFANDLNPRTEAEIRSDYVMGVGTATITLANATVRRKVRRTLDLGSGCGTLSLLAAAHSDEVVALDRNPRAIEFAEFNTRLNRVGNVRHVQGSLFEPVAGETFDLIITNPPFVISPESRYMFRDSGMRGDEICRTIIRQAPAHLNEGGVIQMLCNWAHLSGEDWKEHLAGWFEGSGCDAWVLRSETQDVSTYADVWLRQTERHVLERTPELFGEWMDYYARNRIEAVSAGLITLRRASGRANWVKIEDAPTKMIGPIGDDVMRAFELRTLLHTAGDGELLATRLRVDPEVRMEQHFAPADGGWRGVDSVLYRAAGMASRGKGDPYVAKMIAACTGRRTLADLVEEMAAEIGKPPAEITPAVLGVVRQLMLQSFLVPADAGGPARA